MSKERRKKRADEAPESTATVDVAADTGSSDADAKAAKAARKAEKQAAKDAEKAARKAEKQAAKDAEKAEKAAQPPKFKHLRKRPLSSGKGATPREIGESLVALFNAGKADEAERTWYHRRIESIEADGMVFDGLKGVAEKSAWWLANHTIRAAKAEGPFVCSTGFTVIFSMTIEPKGGAAFEMREAGVYAVEKGRIVREQFMSL
jgi:hypothetical protein